MSKSKKQSSKHKSCLNQQARAQRKDDVAKDQKRHKMSRRERNSLPVAEEVSEKVEQLTDIMLHKSAKYGLISFVEETSKQLTRDGRAFIRLLDSFGCFTNKEIASALGTNAPAVQRTLENRYGKVDDDFDEDEDTYVNSLVPVQVSEPEKNESTSKKKTECEPCCQEEVKRESHSDDDQVSNSASTDNFNIFTSTRAKKVAAYSERDDDSEGYDPKNDSDMNSDSSVEDERHQKIQTQCINILWQGEGRQVDQKQTGVGCRLKIEFEMRSTVGKPPPSPVSVRGTPPPKTKKRKSQEMLSIPRYAQSKVSNHRNFADDDIRVKAFFVSRGYDSDPVVEDLIAAGLGPKELQVLREKTRKAVVKQLRRWGNLLPIKADALAQAIESASSKDWKKLAG
ncbi:hypothetical protein JR316_0013370 [Psilocybe cubensis]|uniref:Uncharacterized protein n=1 Tax=Psilocybe cubensis TaxID=181762 RepID=A0ACB8GHL7_PSICU|nr:hypothetical protein JR316_0013370 [Psilocybe cubensis]KAH9474902.1 hypothetical protein JR316_0013370 [Psilocybe cubensis]